MKMAFYFYLWVTLCVGMVFSPSLGEARTFIVNSTVDRIDINPGDGFCKATVGTSSKTILNTVCTLRAAIQEANAFAGADLIELPTGNYILTRAGAGENAAATGDLDITESLAIVGAGALMTTINGNFLDRVFHALSVDLEIEDLTITGGSASNTHCGGGGGILYLSSGETLTIRDSVITGNEVINATDCIYGGGILANLISDEGEGGVILDHVSIKENRATRGGGIYLSSTAPQTFISHSSISGNEATEDGGGIYIQHYLMSGGSSYQPIIIEATTIAGNIAGRSGGGVQWRAWWSHQPRRPLSVIFNNATISNNSASYGGGIGMLQVCENCIKLSNSIIAGNTLMSGGGTIPHSHDCYIIGHGFLSRGNNVIGIECNSSPITWHSSDLVGSAASPVDPLLEDFLDNGNPGNGHFPLTSGSPAIDSGNPSSCTPYDQLNQSRNGVCDQGAIEF